MKDNLGSDSRSLDKARSVSRTPRQGFSRRRSQRSISCFFFLPSLGFRGYEFVWFRVFGLKEKTGW